MKYAGTNHRGQCSRSPEIITNHENPQIFKKCHRMNTDHQKGLLLSCSLPNLKPEYEIETIHIPAVENIITLVCVQLNIYRQYLFVKDRKPKRVYARQLVMYFLST